MDTYAVSAHFCKGVCVEEGGGGGGERGREWMGYFQFAALEDEAFPRR